MTNEQQATTQALTQAMQMEIDGKEFYLTQSRGSTNIIGKKLFNQLAEEEDMHLKRFEKIFKSISSKKGWPDISIIPHKGDIETLFAEATTRSEYSFTELDAVLTGMRMENKTREFYLNHSENTTFTGEKEFYLALAKEERVHHALLLDYYEYMQDPAQYFTFKEKHSLDGG